MVLKQDKIGFENESRENKVILRTMKMVLSLFLKDNNNKLFWFNEHIKFYIEGKLFRIGDPVLMFEQDLREIILSEGVYSHKYRISKKSLEKLKVNLKKIIEKKLNCYARIRIPLLDSNDPEEWEKAREVRSIRSIWVTAEKKFDGKTMRVCF